MPARAAQRAYSVGNDVMIVSVRHVPLNEAESVLKRWSEKEQGYLFSITAQDKDITEYLEGKYLRKDFEK